MSGIKQHHIPQSVLRAFNIQDGSKRAHDQVFVFRRDKFFPSSTEGVGAQRHFYSEPRSDGTRTLDDIITEYEYRFSGLLNQLRSLRPGESPDPKIAAEVVAHLTIRNDHLRRTLINWTGRLADEAIELFCREDKLRALFGLDGAEFSPPVLAALNNQIESDQRFAQLGLPREVIHKVAFMATKENFSRFVADQLPIFQIMLENYSKDVPDHVRNTHNEVLLNAWAGDQRTEKISTLEWSVREAPIDGAILPDCITLGSEDGGDLKPLMLIDLEKLTSAVMPLSPRTILFGSKPGFNHLNLEKFNEIAAFSSTIFFVSHREGQDLKTLSALIGTLSQKTLEQEIAGIFEGFKKKYEHPQTASTIERSEVSADNGAASPLDQLNDWAISFRGISDEETAYRISGVIKIIVQELRQMMPLDRLDGFTFSEEYESALAELDRGIKTSSILKHDKREYGIGVSMCPVVVRNGVVKSHIVSRMWIARGLISESQDEQLIALHTIVNQLAFASCHQMFDEALPGVFLSPLSDPFDALLYPAIESSWSSYFAARASCLFNPSFTTSYLELASSSIRHARETILSARYNYRFDGNLDKFLNVAISGVKDILSFCSQFLGHCDGLRASAFEDETFNNLLLENGLLNWIELFQADLAKIWEKQGRWNSFDEFTLLERHAERLLWQFGIFPSKNPDGSVYVHVPIQTDAIALSQPKASWRRLRTRIVQTIRRLKSPWFAG